jgi:hypothetical protein
VRYFTFLYAQTRSRHSKKEAALEKRARKRARTQKRGKTPEKSSLRAEALMAKEAPTEIFHKADTRDREGRFYTRKLEKRCYNVLMGHL